MVLLVADQICNSEDARIMKGVVNKDHVQHSPQQSIIFYW